MLASVTASAQVWNPTAEGWSTGFGTVYGSFAVANATQSIYNTTQMQLQQTMNRQALVNRFGEEAVQKLEREQRAATSSAERSARTSQEPTAIGSSRFRPDGSLNVAGVLTDNLGVTPEEKQAIVEAFLAGRQAFESVVQDGAWKHDVAGALAFFVASNAAIYNDEGVSDEATVALYDAFRQSLGGTAEFRGMSDREKEGLYDVLIGFAFITLSTHAAALESEDEASLEEARHLAGGLLELVLQTSPDNIRVEEGAVVLGG